MRRAVLAFFVATACLAANACSDDGAASPDPGPPVTPKDPIDVGVDGGSGELPPPTEIELGPEVVFAARSCTHTLRWTGTASEVQVAGEFTGWAAAPLPMTKTASGFELTLAPGAGLQGGVLYGYKLVVDGDWRLDPEGTHRKLVGGEMNSGLRLPDCAAGPELLSGAVAVARAGDVGTMTVRVEIRAAEDGARPKTVRARFDREELPEGSFTVDAEAGAIDFTLPHLGRGKHTLSLHAVDDADREAAPIDLPFWVEDEAFDYRDGVLYMFLVDRFANGERSNDRPIGTPIHYDADWHGGDLEGALAVMRTGYFEKLGVRTIWLSPANRQTSRWHYGDGTQMYSAYHGYWPVKAREIEPRFGGDAGLRAFVAEAHARGLRVLLDLINNQVHEEHEYLATNASWFRTACQCGTAGCGWSEKPFECLFQPYLPDIDWTVPAAEARFIDDAVHWIADFDLDGFRVDAVKHVEPNSIFNMRAELARRFEQGGARVFMVGETAVGENDNGTFFGEHFASGFAWIDAYTGPNGLDGQFDFPTRHNMADGLVDGTRPFDQVEAQIQKALANYRPESRHVRFLNGHDNRRIASIAAQDPKLGCSWSSGCRDAQLPPDAYSEAIVYARLRRALTGLYTIPGIPYLYAGDEIAMPGGDDPDMRRDMRFGEAALAGVQMAKPGSSPIALTSPQVALRDFTRKLGETRNASRALRRGDRVTLVGDDADLWVYAYKAGAKEIAVVAMSRGGAVSRTVNATTLGLAGGGVTGWTSALGTGTASNAGNDLTITLGAGEAAIFLAR